EPWEEEGKARIEAWRKRREVPCVMQAARGARHSGSLLPARLPCPSSLELPAASGRQRIDDDVDRELRVVLGQEALVAPVVVPFAAVVLVAVEHAEAAADLDALQVVVHEVVAPA